MRVKNWILLSIAAALPGAALAQAQSDRGGIPIGPFRMHPTVGLTFGYDTNTTLSPDDESESAFVRLSPSVRLEGGNAKNNVTITYSSELARYSESEDDDFDDHSLRAAWAYHPKVRHRFNVDGGVVYGHDPRGTGSREGELADLPLDVDRFLATDLGAAYTFGAPGARGRLGFDARVHELEYRNNREFTRFRDRSDWQVGGEFGWRVGGRTAAVFRAEHAEYSYDVATLDGDERHYFVGVDFEATGKTSGRALFGRVEKNFDDPARQDTSGASWRVNLQYRPKSFSTFDFSTGRDIDETNGFGDYILRKDVALGWTYDWTARIRTTLDAGWATEEHQPSAREDDVRYYGASVNYAFRRWLRFGGSIRTYDRDSELSGLDYRRTQVLFSAEASW